MLGLRVSLVVALSSGCGSESPGGSADAGPEDGGTFEPTPPAAAARPVLTPCPDGWREVTDADDPSLVTCDPFGEAGAPDCAGDEAVFPGGSACERIGTACPAGDFADDLPAGANVFYVLAGAAAGGDGSIAAPFATLAEALGAAADGDVIALSKGTFDEAVDIRAAVTIWGACVAETIVASSTSSASQPTLAVEGGGTTIGNLQVSGPRVGLDFAVSGSPNRVESVLVQGARYVGVGAHNGGKVDAQDLVVRGTEPDDSGDFGTGVDVLGVGSEVTLLRAAIEGNHRFGISSRGGARVVATDVLVRDTAVRESTGNQGYGLSLSDGGIIELDRSVIEGNHATAATIDGAHLEANDSVLRDTEVAAAGDVPFGLDLNATASAVLTRTTLSGNGIRGIGPGFELSASDVAIVDPSPSSRGEFGHGLDLALGGEADLHRVALVRCRAAGALVQGLGTSISGDDVVVEHVREEDLDSSGGLGIQATQGAGLDLARLEIADVRMAGIVVHDAESSFVAQDFSVHDVSSRVDGSYGRGLEVGAGATATVERAAFARTRDVAVLVANEDSALSLSDALVEDTLVAECDSCLEGGFGLAAVTGTMTVTRFRISRSALCGLVVALGGQMDLSDGEISENPIGANVQDESFDTARLQSGVLWIDNDTTLDSSALPVPDAIVGI